MSQLKTHLVAVVFTVVVAVVAAACGGGGTSSSASLVTGVDIYSANCAVCHRADGTGSIGPKINDGATIAKYPERADQIELVTNGRNAMPSFGGQLSEAQIGAVVDYVRDDL